MNQEHLRWIEPEPVAIPRTLSDAITGQPLLLETLVRRGLTDPQRVRAFLDHSQYHPADPGDLPDLSRAVDLVEKALRDHRKIAVWGDFDVDGQTATTLLVTVLRDLGGDVIYHIPVRARESHGVNLPALHQLINAGAELIITCDTGITAHEAALDAAGKGIDFVITDHHTLPETLPSAPAIVNPQRLAENHPLRTVCGVGTAYLLAQELCRRWKRPEVASQQLDLVALGTIADLAVLTGDARYHVQRGIELLRDTKRAGLLEMYRLAEIDSGRLSEEHIGFLLAPRMNALGRLSDSNPIVDFLISPASQKVTEFALQMEFLNSQRKLLCDQVFKAAIHQIETTPALLDSPILILNHPLWPAGVIGIVASRLVELYRRPAILISTPAGEIGRASARSVEGLNITSAIAEQAKWLTNFGGHPMAAGLGILPENLPAFRKGMARTVERMLLAQPPVSTLTVDAFLSLPDLTLDLVQDLERLAPFGPGNPPLIFATRNLQIKSMVKLGRTGEHLALTVEDEYANQQRLIWWQGAGSPLPEGKLDLAYSLRASNFRGKLQVQAEFIAARPVCETIEIITHPQVLVHDHRLDLESERVLSNWDGQTGLILGEGKNIPQGSVNRLHLEKSFRLAFWTTPPSMKVFRDILAKTKPKEVLLFDHPAETIALPELLKTLGGLIQYILHKQDGKASLTDLASASATTEALVRLGLAWWAARGQIRIELDGDNVTIMAVSSRPDQGALKTIESQIQQLLDEVLAFQAFYRKADADALVNAGLIEILEKKKVK